MNTEDKQLQPRFRVNVVGSGGRVVSQERTDHPEQAMRTFVRLSESAFGPEQGRGSYVALTDSQLKLDASKMYEGFGTYQTRFAKEEGRAAYEALIPPTEVHRFPVDADGHTRAAASMGTPSQMSKDEPHVRKPAAPVLNEITALEADRAESPARAAARALDPRAADEVATAGAAVKLDELADDRQKPGHESRALRPAYPPLQERFNVVEAMGKRVYEFRNEPGKVAFTERWLQLQASTDNPAVVKAMVDRAEERGWGAIRVAGSEEFKRQAWIAAEARGIKVVGYEPTQGDRSSAVQERDRLAKERDAEPALAAASAGGSITRDAKPSRRAERDEHREAPVMLALERAMDAKRIPAAQRENVRKAVQEQLDAFSRNGKMAKVKILDPAASRQIPRTVQAGQEHRPGRDRVM